MKEMGAREFINLYRGLPCYVTDSQGNRRKGRVSGLSPYGTVVVEFEPYPEPSKVGQYQEWPVSAITITS